MPPKRIPKKPPTEVNEWDSFLRNAARTKWITITASHSATATKLAALIRIVGPVSSQEGTDFFWAVSTLFFHEKRVPRWAATVDIMPPNRKVLIRITESMEEYRRRNKELEKRSRFLVDMSKAKINLTEVVQTMLDTSSPKDLLEYAVGRGVLHPAQIFSAKTLEQAKKNFRGALTGDSESFLSDMEQSGLQEVEV